jgi:hypothetical protein
MLKRILQQVSAIALGLLLFAGPFYTAPAYADSKQSALPTVSPACGNTVTGLQSGANVNNDVCAIALLMKSAANLTSGTLPQSALPAFSGGCVSSAGSTVLTCIFATTKVTICTASCNPTFLTTTNRVFLYLQGGGGGGGGGAQCPSTTTCSGGASGAGGSCVNGTFNVADVGTAITITIPSAAAGGLAATSTTTAGGAGGTGNNVTATGTGAFAATAYGGGGGAGGQPSAAQSGGGGGGSPFAAGTAGSGSTAGASGRGNNAIPATSATLTNGQYPADGVYQGAGAAGVNGVITGSSPFGGISNTCAPSGGAGGWITTPSTSNNGGAGGASAGVPVAATGGTSGTPNGQSLVPTITYLAGGGGGGGWGNAAGNSGSGGAGTNGAGGGGGGTSPNGSTPGTGGAGGLPFGVIVETS